MSFQNDTRNWRAKHDKHLEDAKVEIDTIGAASVNQAVKAVAIARGYLAPSGIDLVCKPAFSNVEINGEKKTSVKLICEKIV